MLRLVHLKTFHVHKNEQHREINKQEEVNGLACWRKKFWFGITYDSKFAVEIEMKKIGFWRGVDTKI